MIPQPNMIWTAEEIAYEDSKTYILPEQTVEYCQFDKGKLSHCKHIEVRCIFYLIFHKTTNIL